MNSQPLDHAQSAPRTQSTQRESDDECDLLVDSIEEPNPILNQITNAIIGAAIRVHRVLGPGFQESVYERAMIIELTRIGIPFQSQARFEVCYDGQVVGDVRLDMVVQNAVILELKAVEAIAPIHRAQVISYLKATGYRLALLINFNVPKLKEGIRRIAL